MPVMPTKPIWLVKLSRLIWRSFVSFIEGPALCRYLINWPCDSLVSFHLAQIEELRDSSLGAGFLVLVNAPALGRLCRLRPFWLWVGLLADCVRDSALIKSCSHVLMHTTFGRYWFQGLTPASDRWCVSRLHSSPSLGVSLLVIYLGKCARTCYIEVQERND